MARFNFTIKGNEKNGITLSIHENNFIDSNLQIRTGLNYVKAAKGMIYKHTLKVDSESNEKYYETLDLGFLHFPTGLFENNSITDDNYEDIKEYLIEYFTKQMII